MVVDVRKEDIRPLARQNLRAEPLKLLVPHLSSGCVGQNLNLHMELLVTAWDGIQKAADIIALN